MTLYKTHKRKNEQETAKISSTLMLLRILAHPHNHKNYLEGILYLVSADCLEYSLKYLYLVSSYYIFRILLKSILYNMLPRMPKFKAIAPWGRPGNE